MTKQRKKALIGISVVVVLILVVRIAILNMNVGTFGTYCGGLSTADPYDSHRSNCVCLGEKETHVGIGATTITCNGIVLW